MQNILKNRIVFAGLIAGAVTALLLVVAVSRSSDSTVDVNPDNQSQLQNGLEVEQGVKSGELPDQIISGLFVMKVSVSDSSGVGGEFIIDFISDDEFQLSGVFDGQQIAYVVSNGFAYVNNGGQWARTNAGGIESLFSIEDLSLSDSDYEQFKQSADFIGEADCQMGRCDVWEATIPRQQVEGDSDSARVFVSKSTRQIVRIEARTADASTAVVTYDYNTIPSVRPPANFTDLEIPGL